MPTQAASQNPMKMRGSKLRFEVAKIAEKVERRSATPEEVARLQELRHAGYARGLYYSL